MEKQAILSIDAGSTHFKAALVSLEGEIIREDSFETPTRQLNECGRTLYFYDPEELFDKVVLLLNQVASAEDSAVSISAVSVTGMAEAGLFLDGESGTPLTHIIPWFDQRTTKLYQRFKECRDEEKLFMKTGLRTHYKYGVFKMQWLLKELLLKSKELLWLSVPDYLVFRMTDRAVTDRTLAARSYLFDFMEEAYDSELISAAGLYGIRLPEVVPSGSSAGSVKAAVARQIFGQGTCREVKVIIAGHDHFAAALGDGVMRPGTIFDSMGTAESLVGVLDAPPGLDKTAYDSGLSFGFHLLPGFYTWLGSVAASGASIEWIRELVRIDEDGAAKLAYGRFEELIDREPAGACALFYLPYLTGSNAPIIDPDMRAAFIGLGKDQGIGTLLKAVVEGISYEVEWIIQMAEHYTGLRRERIRVAGGGANSSQWMQIKADMAGSPLEVSNQVNASLVGAALIGATVGTGELSFKDLGRIAEIRECRTFSPDSAVHAKYQELFQSTYLPLQMAVGSVMGAKV